MSDVMGTLRRAIMETGESMNAVSKGSGVHRSQISRLLNTDQDPGVGTVNRLADYLGYELVLRRTTRGRKVK